MAGSVTKYIAQAMGKPSFKEAVRGGAAKALIDGSLGEILLNHGPGSELIGTDAFGNKYFEKKDTQIGRNRFVVYAKADHWSQQDPSTIPPEWHSWLHHMADDNPTNTEYKRPIYSVEAAMHPSVTGPLGAVSSSRLHQPKGSWSNPDRLTWRKIQAWTPPKA